MANCCVIFVLALVILLVHTNARNVPNPTNNKGQELGDANVVNVPKAMSPDDKATNVKDKKCGVAFAGAGGAAGVGGVAGFIPLGGIGGVGVGIGGFKGIGGGLGGGVGGFKGIGGIGGIGGAGGGAGGAGSGVIP